MKSNMTIQQWLSDVYYDAWGQRIWNKEDEDGGSEPIAIIRGWGRLQHEFDTDGEAAKFQDEVGQFIVEAIREKVDSYRVREVKDSEIENVNVEELAIAWLTQDGKYGLADDAMDREIKAFIAGYLKAKNHDKK